VTRYAKTLAKRSPDLKTLAVSLVKLLASE
jgi:hypothetical protein